MSSSAARLPGSSANTGCATPSFSCSRASRREPRRGRVLRERMADERHRHAGFLVDRRLERKQREHPVDRAPDLAHALAPPRPHRRAHEMHGAHARALELRFEAEVEIRRVDADEDRHALGAQPSREPAAQCEELRQAGQHLDQPAHRQRFQRIPGLAAGRLHPGPGDADEADLRQPRAHGADQCRGERVAGGLAGDDADGHCAGAGGRVRHPAGQCPHGRPRAQSPPRGAANVVSVGVVHPPARPPEGHCAPPRGASNAVSVGSFIQRMMPRPGSPRNSTSGASTGVPAAASASTALASSSVRPSR